MVSASSVLLRSSMQQVSLPADMYPRPYTQGTNFVLVHLCKFSHLLTDRDKIVYLVFIVTKLKNLGSTIQLPPEERIDTDDTHTMYWVCARQYPYVNRCQMQVLERGCLRVSMRDTAIALFLFACTFMCAVIAEDRKENSCTTQVLTGPFM